MSFSVKKISFELRKNLMGNFKPKKVGVKKIKSHKMQSDKRDQHNQGIKLFNVLIMNTFKMMINIIKS